MSPQLARLDAYFNAGGSLTLAEALAAPIRCAALSQRCGELRRLGKPIVTTMEPNGQGGRHARYRYAATQRDWIGDATVGA